MVMNLKSIMFLIAAIIMGVFTINLSARADDTMKEKASEAASDTGRAAKKAGRVVRDKTCEMVNGKMKCAVKKVKHSIQNGADNIEDAVD